VIGVNAHLTTLTAALVRELTLGGGEWVVSAANEATTDIRVVELLRGQGIAVHTGGDLRNCHKGLLDHRPDLIADVGFGLLGTLLDHRPEQVDEVQAAVEITRSGISRLRSRSQLPWPVVNLNDGLIKHNIENRRGVGEALWTAVRDLTGTHLSGRRVLVVGYGPVGQGVAAYAKAHGAVVEVYEVDPIRCLVAHYDGFATPELLRGLEDVEIVVTATGRRHAISVELLRGLKNGVVLVNAGHGGDEIDIDGLKAAASSGIEIGDNCTRYRIGKGPWLSVLGDGHPLNIVTNAGSPEPVLLHFAVVALTLEWLAKETPRTRGEVPVPRSIEEEAARLALRALTGRS
jgi:adenosylhomocysteinase